MINIIIYSPQISMFLGCFIRRAGSGRSSIIMSQGVRTLLYIINGRVLRKANGLLGRLSENDALGKELMEYLFDKKFVIAPVF